MSDRDQGFARRRRLLLGLAGGAVAGTHAMAAPKPPVPLLLPRLRIFIPANAGGGWDQTGRALGAAIVAAGAVGEVDYQNLGGNGGIPGLAKFVELHDNDPAAILMGGLVMVGAMALRKPPVGLNRVEPLARLTSDYEVIAVKADSPLRTTKDLVQQMRTNPTGTVLAGGSAGGVDHMFAGMLARTAGSAASLAYLPFGGGAQVVESIENGKAAAGISGVSEFKEGLAAGKLRAIGTSSRRPFLGIPSAREQGVDVDMANWRGVFTGKAVGSAQRSVLLEAVRAGVANDQWVQAIRRNNWDPAWLEGKDLESFVQFELSMADILVYLLKLK